MKARPGFCSTVIAAVLAFGMASAAAATAGADAHGHEGSAIGALKLNAGKKWQTDAPLRQGMDQIRSAIVADKTAIHTGKLSAASYGALAKKVETQVAYMIQNCKLPADADAQLHLIIADLTSGADAMKGKDPAARKGGAEKIVAALEAYGKHFDHPGWRGV